MNLLEMAEEEHRLVRDGVALHGEFFENAAGTTVAFSNLVGQPIADCESFIRFHAKAKKHHTLAVLSAVRRHRAQASLNLRSYLEATVQAAFALAHPDVSTFFDLTKMIPVDEQKVMRRAYTWLADRYPPSNESIKGLKVGSTRPTPTRRSLRASTTSSSTRRHGPSTRPSSILKTCSS
jgi:hypothetical protein